MPAIGRRRGQIGVSLLGPAPASGEASALPRPGARQVSSCRKSSARLGMWQLTGFGIAWLAYCPSLSAG